MLLISVYLGKLPLEMSTDGFAWQQDQVDILISTNQTLQILYLKHDATKSAIMDNKLTKSMKI